MAIRVEIFGSIDDARETWLEFERRGDLTVFQTLEWIESWYHRIGRRAGVELCLVAAYEGNDPLCFFPFAIVRRAFARALVWAGGNLCDYGAPILVRGEPLQGAVRSERRGDGAASPQADASSDAGFERVWERVLRRIPPVDFVWLVRIPERIAGRANPMCRLKCDPYHSSAYATKLSGTWEEIYEAHAGPKTRSTDRRKSRRLGEMGEVTWTVTDGSDAACFRRIAEAMIEQKQHRYREIRARNALDSEGARNFFVAPVESLVRSGRLNLSELSVGGSIVATHWGMVYRKRFYYFMPSFAPGPWTKFSPGRLLLFRLFQWCVDRGIEVFDFTVGDEAYKRDWCDDEMRLYQIFLARTAKGRLFSILYKTYLNVARNRCLLGAARRARRVFYSARRTGE